MNTSLTLLDRQLELWRYPEKFQHPSLQAWDAADEYLIETVETEHPINTDQIIHIFNDNFGTLACWFAAFKPECWQDSLVATVSTQRNLSRNGLENADVTLHSSTVLPKTQPDVVLIKLPKSLALLEHQLICLQQVVKPDTVIIAAGMAKLIQKSTLALFEKHLGTTTTSLAKKKARLIFAKADGNKTSKNPYPTEWKTERPTFTLVNHANVFSRQQLDIGARFLMEYLPDSNGKKVIDLGCGNGVLGLSVLHHSPDSRILFVDESFMAVASARDNVAKNFPDKLNQCEFLVSNCLSQLPQDSDFQQVDLVLCNPPFHQQNTITDHIARQMFSHAKRHLVKNGELRVVANSHLPYPKELKALFGGFRQVATNRKFSILSSQKK